MQAVEQGHRWLNFPKRQWLRPCEASAAGRRQGTSTLSFDSSLPYGGCAQARAGGFCVSLRGVEGSGTSPCGLKEGGEGSEGASDTEDSAEVGWSGGCDEEREGRREEGQDKRNVLRRRVQRGRLAHHVNRQRRQRRARELASSSLFSP